MSDDPEQCVHREGMDSIEIGTSFRVIGGVHAKQPDSLPPAVKMVPRLAPLKWNDAVDAVIHDSIYTRRAN